MEVRKGIIIPLGYGKYFLSDKIVGFVRIEKDRGPARRTHVYVDGLSEPIVASRTEETMLRDMTLSGPGEFEAVMAKDLLERIHNDLQGVGPMLRRSIREETGLDIDDMDRRVRKLLSGPEPTVQEGLFKNGEQS